MTMRENKGVPSTIRSRFDEKQIARSVVVPEHIVHTVRGPLVQRRRYQEWLNDWLKVEVSQSVADGLGWVLKLLGWPELGFDRRDDGGRRSDDGAWPGNDEVKADDWDGRQLEDFEKLHVCERVG